MQRVAMGAGPGEARQGQGGGVALDRSAIHGGHLAVMAAAELIVAGSVAVEGIGKRLGPLPQQFAEQRGGAHQLLLEGPILQAAPRIVVVAMAADLMAGRAGPQQVGPAGIEPAGLLRHRLAAVNGLSEFRQQALHRGDRHLFAQGFQQGPALEVGQGRQPPLGEGGELGLELRLVPDPVEGVLPDQLLGIDQGTRLKDRGADAKPAQHRQTVGVVVEQAVIEAHQHREAIRRWLHAPKQIGEGEEQGPLALQEGQFGLQLLGGDRRHAVGIEEGHLARQIHPVVQKAVGSAPPPPAPVAVEGGHEQQIPSAVAQSLQEAHGASGEPTRRTDGSLPAAWPRCCRSSPCSILRLASRRWWGS